MLTLKEKLGKRIKELRKKNNFSQEKLAEIIDMDIPNLSNIERGKRFMTAETLEKFVAALNTTEYDLFDFREFEPNLYYKTDIEKLLSDFSDTDMEFILNVIKSYKKAKDYRV